MTVNKKKKRSFGNVTKLTHTHTKLNFTPIWKEVYG